ncbi:MAG TPA: hypothetical protein VD866_32190 [Urbifossiella sp.]|nr:hypothetical protein [Urbifossiella sp.]
MNTDTERLAQLVLQTLAAQQVYFKTKRPGTLDAAKELEEQLRQMAALVSGPLGSLTTRTLNRQKDFFATGNRSLMYEAKQLERQLKAAANETLHPKQEQLTLFGGDQ